MKCKSMLISMSIAISIAVLARAAFSAGGRVQCQVPDGLAFSEFRGSKAGR
jgi:hypothetical protein